MEAEDEITNEKVGRGALRRGEKAHEVGRGEKRRKKEVGGVRREREVREGGQRENQLSNNRAG